MCFMKTILSRISLLGLGWLVICCAAASDESPPGGGAAGSAGVAGAAGAGGASNDAGTDAIVTVDAPDPPATCNDLVCDAPEETCENCATDCGECPVCNIAPTCTGALAVPDSTKALAECNGKQRSSYSCGSKLAPGDHDCLDPQLRLRIRELRIERHDAIQTSKNVYCVIVAEDGARTELVVTSARKVTGKDFTINFPLAEGAFWGQQELVRSTSNLSINYRCFHATNPDGTKAVVKAIGDGLVAVGGALSTTPYGWVILGAGAATGAASSAINKVGDTVLGWTCSKPSAPTHSTN